MILLCSHLCRLRKKILAMAKAIQSGKIPEDSDASDARERMLKSIVLPIAREFNPYTITVSVCVNYHPLSISRCTP